MKKLEKNNIPEQIINKPLYLYGAGYTARICIKALETENIKIVALIDDDMMKQGTKVLSYMVLSYEEFLKRHEDNENVNVILTSIYGKAIYNKLVIFPNITI